MLLATYVEFMIKMSRNSFIFLNINLNLLVRDLYILSDGSFYSHNFRSCLSQKSAISVPLVFRKLLKEKWDDFVSVCVMSFDMLRTDCKQLNEYAKLMFSQHDPIYVEKKISSRCTIEARNELCEILLSYNWLNDTLQAEVKRYFRKPWQERFSIWFCTTILGFIL